MKVCILAFDGLDYYRVHQGDYPNLKQKEYGIVDISGLTLKTPVLWGSFITGLEQTQHKVRFSWKFLPQKIYDPVIIALERMADKISLLNTASFFKLVKLVGLWHTKDDYARKGVKTIFDYARKPVAISVPSYNQPVEDLWLMVKSDLVKSADEKKLIARYVWRIHYRRKKQLFEELTGDWDLLMVWFPLADALGHLFWFDEKLMKKIYNELEGIAGAVRAKLDDALILINSDHGMKEGQHTRYAFYSSNVKLGLTRPRITSFFQIIVSAVCGELGEGGAK